uniref:Endo/exonuclease/phosphatase domain-containing protein n=1 Tax=Echinostoma caproni TaxID=27848 RepID=A0A183AYX2_9TREM
LQQFQQLLKDDYWIFSPTDNPFGDCAHYFVVLLIRRHPAIDVDQSSFRVHNYPNSTMGRQLVWIDLTIHCDKLTSNRISSTITVRLFTSHLESCRESSKKRKDQLSYAWSRMIQFGSTSNSVNNNRPGPRAAIFCGDLNLRDTEVQELGGLPAGIEDAWQVTGSRPELRNTWDPQRNTNASRLGFGGRGPHGRSFTFRYDRMYVHGSCLRPVDFGLRGLERVPGTRCFPSDHWGILGRFQPGSA